DVNLKNLNELHTKLREDLINQQGDVSFNLAGINHTLTSSDIIGNCIQSWLKSWFAINKVKFRELDNTQEFPDYFVELNGIEYMLEIKCWNAKASPAFDIANITSYLNMIKQSPKKLEANYFIFAYHYDINTAKITIDNVYNKKIYEIAGL